MKLAKPWSEKIEVIFHEMQESGSILILRRDSLPRGDWDNQKRMGWIKSFHDTRESVVIGDSRLSEFTTVQTISNNRNYFFRRCWLMPPERLRLTSTKSSGSWISFYTSAINPKSVIVSPEYAVSPGVLFDRFNSKANWLSGGVHQQWLRNMPT